MPAIFSLTLRLPNKQIVSHGRQLTRLYRTANSAGFRGHNPGALVITRIEGRADAKTKEMVYSLEIELVNPNASPLPAAADWSLLDPATDSTAPPRAPDLDSPTLTHSPPGETHERPQ